MINKQIQNKKIKELYDKIYELLEIGFEFDDLEKVLNNAGNDFMASEYYKDKSEKQIEKIRLALKNK
jgi:hypothetical protein